MSAAMGASNASTSLLGVTWTANALRLHRGIEMQYLKLKLEPTNPQGGTCASKIKKKKNPNG